jgi:DNA-binding beta-propeller fold protein YncE
MDGAVHDLVLRSKEREMALKQVGFIPVPPGSQPGFDHADVWQGRSSGDTRLYVAHTGADCLEVIDCATNTYLRALPDLPGVAGVLIDNEQDLLFSSDRGCARASIFRCSDETLLGQVAVGQRPNGLAYDPSRRRLFVFNIGDPPGQNCTASVVALDELQVVRTVALPGRPRWAVYDPATDQVFANIQMPPQIVVLDAKTMEIARAIHVPAVGPHGLALSGEHLFCAADGSELVVLHRDTGTVVGTIGLAGEPDVIMQDQVLGRLYVAVGSPGVVHVLDSQRLAPLEIVPTELGAHTIGWNPGGRTLYVFLPSSEGAAVFCER